MAGDAAGEERGGVSQWFRMYTEVLNDAKAQRLPGELFKAWVNLLCVAKEREGVLPPLTETAFALRKSEKETLKILKALTDAGLLDQTGTGLSPHNWNVRQYKSDVSTERVKRFRQRSKDYIGNVSATADETPPDTETESDTETEQKETPRAQALAEFDRWYEGYPKKVGRGQAERAYLAARKHTSAEDLLAGAERYRATLNGTEPRFIAHPATWLNGKRWLDEGVAPPKGHDAAYWEQYFADQDRKNDDQRIAGEADEDVAPRGH